MAAATSLSPPLPRHGLLLAIAYVAFVSLGLPDAALGVAWPSLRDAFGVPQSALGAILVALGAGYFISSFFSGRLVGSLGVGALLTVSSALVAASALGYVAAPAWPVLLGCAVLGGLGSGGIDAGLNAYAAQHFSSRHMSWLHACYGVGAMLGPLIMTAAITRLGGWERGYSTLGACLGAMTLLFAVTARRWQRPATTGALAEPPVGPGALLGRAPVQLQVGLFFLYSGLEATAGQWCFTWLTEGRLVSPAVAGVWAGAYWAALAAGRVAFGLVVERLGPRRTVRLGLAGVALGVLLLAVPRPVQVGLAGLVVLGFSLAPIFPTLMAETPRRLGAAAASHAVGFQVSAAMLGVAILPGVAGLLAERQGLETLALVLLGLTTLLVAGHEALLGLLRRRALS